MDQNPNEATATRAVWLAELAVAIEQAQRLTWRIGVSEGENAEAMRLYARLDVLLAEVESLRRGGWTGEHRELDPLWMQLLSSGSAGKMGPDEAGERAA